MTKRELQSEVTRLRAKQLKARQDEPFLGFSFQEKEEYDARTDRIHDLDVQLEALGLARRRLRIATGIKQRKLTRHRVGHTHFIATASGIRAAPNWLHEDRPIKTGDKTKHTD